jgi:hypothetical protein
MKPVQVEVLPADMDGLLLLQAEVDAEDEQR